MRLHEALGVSGEEVVAFTGAGGKSGAILALADELRGEGLTVLVAPTTKMFLKEAERVGPLVTAEDRNELRAGIKQAISGSEAVVAGSGLLSKKRVGGVDPGWVSFLAPLADVTLVEADGSRRRPLKGTASHEPLLPDGATLVVAVGNVEALGQPVDEEHVHRPEIFSELTGIEAGQSITARAFARALVKGSLGKAPPEARKAALISGVSPGRSMADAAAIAREIWKLGVEKVVLASLPGETPPHVWVP